MCFDKEIIKTFNIIPLLHFTLAFLFSLSLFLKCWKVHDLYKLNRLAMGRLIHALSILQGYAFKCISSKYHCVFVVPIRFFKTKQQIIVC